MKKFISSITKVAGHVIALPFRIVGFIIGVVFYSFMNGVELADDFMIWISSE